VAFDLSLCRAADGSALNFHLDFGDGADAWVGGESEPIVPHIYEQGGDYTARLLVTDQDGRWSTSSLPITVAVDPEIGLELGMRAPDFEADTVEGSRLRLSNTRGSVVLLDFWGAWCAPCRRSLPHLQSLLDAFEDDGLVVILVSTDNNISDAQQYLTENNYTDLNCVWAPGGKRGSPIVELYDMAGRGIPKTFVLDRQGIIRYIGHPSNLSGSAVETLL
jgi:peroxiredoxin